MSFITLLSASVLGTCLGIALCVCIVLLVLVPRVQATLRAL